MITPYYEKTFDRHKRDLDRVASGAAPHIRFNEKLGKKYIIYIQMLKHHTGILAGQLIKLEMWQKKVVMIAMGWETKSSTGGWVRRFSEVLLFLPRKNGKDLCLETPIPTPSGYIKNGDLKIGDTVFSVDGTTTKVTQISDYTNRDVYEVEFSNGEIIKAGATHDWYLSRRSEKYKKYTTIELLQDYKQKRKYKKKEGFEYIYRTKIADCIDAHKKDLPIDPYLFGLWLGDGSYRSPKLHLNEKDEPEISGYIKIENELIRTSRGCTDILIGKRGSGARKNPFTQDIKKLKVFANKHIPESYLFASKKQRIELLKGLLDTDGYCSKANEIEIIQVKKDLAYDIRDLLASLGVKSKIKIKIINGVEYFRLNFYTDFCPFKLKRKVKTWKSSIRKHSRSKTISVVRVEKVKSVPTRCIGVDHPSHLYLCGRQMIPTHNTLLLSALTIVDSILRGETRGEVVFVGSKRDQAKIPWNGAVAMIESHPELNKTHTNSYNTLTLTKNKTTFKTLGRDSGSEDGANTSIAGFDEKHSYPDTKLIDVVKSSMKARKQPLSMTVSTAGFNNASPLISDVKYAKDILEERIEDDSYFAFIAEAPAGADIFDEETWRAANPNYGVSINVDNFKKEAMNAKRKPEELHNFMVKSLNIFVSVSEAYFDYQQWLTCRVNEFPKNKTISRVLLGLDLSYVDDMSALAKITEFTDGSVHVETNIYIPKDSMADRERELRAPLVAWFHKGHIIATPGKIIDLEWILKDLREMIAEDTVQYLGYDPYRAKSIIFELENDQFPNSIAIRQTTLGLSAALIRFNNDIRRNNVTYQENDVLDWHVSNTGIVSDSSGNIKPSKLDLKNKIDAVAAIVNAYCLLTQDPPEDKTSVYESRGLRRL